MKRLENLANHERSQCLDAGAVASPHQGGAMRKLLDRVQRADERAFTLVAG